MTPTAQLILADPLASPTRKGIGGHHRGFKGKTDAWLTPPWILKALGHFDLDPCAAPDPRPWPTAETHWTGGGLMRPWFGRVFLNPPYSELGPWLERLADHGDGIALVFARTETATFFRWVWPRASAVFFIRGRLHFHRADGERAAANSGGPSVLIAYGSACADVLRCVRIPGKFVPLTDGK